MLQSAGSSDGGKEHPYLIFNGDCLDLLNEIPVVPLIFADPPDNLGLAYDTYVDQRPGYHDWLELVIRKSLTRCKCFWLSYYWEHDLEIKYRVRNIIRFTPWSAKTFVWRYTFGQYKDTDSASGFRFLLRFTRPDAINNVDAIRVPSARMRIGDSRAAGPRVPDDVMEIPGVFDDPRVVGNAGERRNWHPTQHPEALYERIIKVNSNPGDLCVDLFGGTGTMIRACKTTGRRALISEISTNYCQRISEDTGGTILPVSAIEYLA